MKRKLLVLAILILSCTLATPVLAGKGGSSNGNRSQMGNSSGSGFGTMTKSQTRQQNQLREQRKTSSTSSPVQNREQLRTRELQTDATSGLTESQPLVPQTLTEQ